MSSNNFVIKASGAAVPSPAALIELAQKSWDAISLRIEFSKERT